MADSTLAALTAASALDGTELLYALQGGADRKATGAQIRTYAQTGLATVATSGAYSDLTGTPTKNNATGSDPTVNSDSSAGYAVGSIWMNSSTRSRWVCADASVGAAKWLLMDYADHPGYVANQWYYPMPSATQTGGSLSAGTMRFVPFILKERVTITALGVRITTAGAGGGGTDNIDLAIYASTAPGAVQRPTGAALASTGAIVSSSVAAVSGAVSKQLEPGLYWLGFNCQTACTCVGFNPANGSTAYIIGGTTQALLSPAASPVGFLSSAQAFGTWPDMTAVTPTELSSSANAAIHFKVGSVP